MHFVLQFYYKTVYEISNTNHLITNKKAMTTHQILNASLLDILFENRNKEYGAYTIRKEYSKNLMKALGLMVLLVFSISIYVVSRPSKTIVRIIPFHMKPDHVLENIKDPEKPKEPEPQRTVPAQPPTRVDRQIVIVPDDKVIRNPVIDRTDTLTYVPGSTNSISTGNDGHNFVQGTTSTTTTIISEPPPIVEPPAPAVLGSSEIPPEFPGGTEAWINYLQRMLRVPDDLEAGDRKTVLVKFGVNADGDVTDAMVMKSGGNAFDKEVLRVISRMPKWKPGKQNGKAVAVYFTQPVTFAVSEE
jgi:protein TonB